MHDPELCDFNLNAPYELLASVKGSVGCQPQTVGTRGVCRFCGERNERCFRRIAHTFPEALGNKWIVSLDECDRCNHAFSSYESALATAVGPILALGGVSGKHSKDRQIGRSNGARVLRHSMIDDRRRPTVVCNGIGLEGIEPQMTAGGLLKLKMPIAATPFRPRMAYKAIAKMGLALLPDAELANYQQLRAWLRDPNEQSDFRNLSVAMSFASIGNSPELVSGTLLKRVNCQVAPPHVVFIFCAGSVCLQIGLMSDRVDGNLSKSPVSRVGISCKSVVQGPKGQALEFDYGEPVHQDWSSLQSKPQPIDFFWFEFNPRTCEGHLTPVFCQDT